MRRSVHLVVLIILTLMLVNCSGCFSYLLEPTASYPVYERVDSEEDGITVDFEGVIYKMYPLTKWDSNPDGKLVGYAGTKDTIICLAEGDTEKNFIYLQDNGASMYYRPLYRTDREVPDPSGENIDEIVWTEYDFNDDKSENYGRHFEDKETIKRLFKVWDTGEKTQEYEGLPDISVRMFCTSSQVPGGYLEFHLVQSPDYKIMMGTPDQGYTEIPIELLEEISGRDIDVDYWIN